MQDQKSPALAAAPASTDAESIATQCAGCRKNVRVVEPLPGSVLRCHCGGTITVPGTPELQFVLSRLSSSLSKTRLNAVVVIFKHFPQEAPSHLRHLVDSDPAPDVRSLARRALDVLSSEEGAADQHVPPPPVDREHALKTAEAETDPIVLAAAITRLGEIGISDDQAVVERFLDHSSNRVRANAVEALAKLSRPGIHQGIVAAMADEDPRVATTAAEIVSNVDPMLGLQTLTMMVISPSPSARDCAMHACSKLALDPARLLMVLPLLERGMKDDVSSVRDKARAALGVLAGKGNRQARDLLAEAQETTSGTASDGFSEFVPPVSPKQDVDDIDLDATRVVENYTWGAATAMFAVPLPGVDMIATYGVWAKMIKQIARVYHYEVSIEDGKRLASDLFKGVILTTAAWFASAKLASGMLKFIPGAGTVTAYALDAAVAAFGAKKITAGVGVAAAAYYKSGKRLAPNSLVEHVKKVLGDPKTVYKVIHAIQPGFPDDDDDLL